MMRRFVAKDAIDGASGQIGESNPYWYTLNSPASFIDPSGRTAERFEDVNADEDLVSVRFNQPSFPLMTTVARFELPIESLALPRSELVYLDQYSIFSGDAQIFFPSFYSQVTVRGVTVGDQLWSQQHTVYAAVAYRFARAGLDLEVDRGPMTVEVESKWSEESVGIGDIAYPDVETDRDITYKLGSPTTMGPILGDGSQHLGHGRSVHVPWEWLLHGNGEQWISCVDFHGEPVCGLPGDLVLSIGSPDRLPLNFIKDDV